MWPFSAGPAYAGTLILDGQVVLKDLPLEVGAWVNSLAEVSISCDKETAAAVWIDDLELKLQDAGFSPKDKSGKTLFLMPVAKEGFESYKRKEFPLYGGFVTSQELLAEGASLPVVDNYEYAAGMQSLRLKDGEGGAALIVKRFALPERFPFDTSDGNFAITNETRIASRGVVAAESREQSAGNRAGDRERVRDRISRRQKAAQSAYAEENRVREQESARNAVTQGAVGTGAKARTLSASTFGGSFYVYSYDGRLLAEYNGYDDCVKDYIYIGNRLLAEYKPQEDQMYFYTPDQINSTRIVTDETGTVVYSAAHDPYGGMQKTWVNTYDPTPKFSGKERDGDAESGLDYFGARYYDKEQYRFISVDPVISPKAIGNAQRWNLYSYCGNNPISFIDPDGRCYLVFYSGQNIIEFYSGAGDLIRTDRASNRAVGGHPPYSPGPHVFQKHNEESWEDYWPGMDAWGILLFIQEDNPGAGVHAGYRPGDWEAATYGCIRTTPWAMCNYVMYMEDHPEDPMTELIVVPWEPLLPDVWPPILALPVQPIVILVPTALPPPRIWPLMF